MRIDWKNDDRAPLAKVFDLYTGQQLPMLAWADDETGEYGQYALGELKDGKYSKIEYENGMIKILHQKGRIEIRPFFEEIHVQE